jgi:hypothetical protein
MYVFKWVVQFEPSIESGRSGGLGFEFGFTHSLLNGAMKF